MANKDLIDVDLDTTLILGIYKDGTFTISTVTPDEKFFEKPIDFYELEVKINLPVAIRARINQLRSEHDERSTNTAE